MGSPHVCWKIAKDVIESNFVPEYLVPRLGRGYVTEVLMRPGVTGNLVTFGSHSLRTLVNMYVNCVSL